MATRLVRRNSYDQFRENNNNELESYVCSCGQEYMSEEHLKRHQQSDCKNRSSSCSFCQETFPSSAELRNHLFLCGNKTDQCPNCRKLIRRSHFAYHYENNCAPVNEVETPPLARKNRSTENFPTNSNKPYLREDIPSDDYPSIYSARVNGKTQSPISNAPGSSEIVECEYCHKQYAKDDYLTHRDNCLQNPIKANQRLQPSRMPVKPNQNSNNSNGIVHIPCEICKQPVDILNWSRHTQDCRERQAQKHANTARSMSREPVIEQLPCEYCEQLVPPKQLQSHEANCPKNPDYTDSAARLARRQPTTFILPTRSNNNRIHSTTQNVRGPNNLRPVYQSIDLDRTHAANKSHNNNRPIHNNQPSITRTASDEVVLLSENSPRGGGYYDNESIQSNEQHLYQNTVRSTRQRPSNGTSQRLGSSFDNLRDDQDPRYHAASNRPTYTTDRRPQPRLHPVHGSFEVIDNRPGQRLIKKNKPPLLKRLFGCAADTRTNEDRSYSKNN